LNYKIKKVKSTDELTRPLPTESLLLFSKYTSKVHKRGLLEQPKYILLALLTNAKTAAGVVSLERDCKKHYH
jgi:hypothetical protein